MADLRQLQQLAADAAGIGVWERDMQGHRHRWDAMMLSLFDLAPDAPPL
jgi:PAS domain-containing protein